MKFTRLLLPITLLTVLLSAAFFARATCVPGDTGTAGNDTINCDVANPPAGAVTGQGGDDTINIGAGVVGAVSVSGDVLGGGLPGAGNDTITNDGSVTNIFGDASSGNGAGSDNIVNNGTVTGLVTGDAFNGSGSGSDTIVNNGTIGGTVLGDSNNTTGSGSDVIINNGTVNNTIMGDSSLGTGSGNDVIVNNGVVTGGVFGDSQNSTGTGSDVLVNTGSIDGGAAMSNVMAGESNAAGIASGNDTLINDGFIRDGIYGDSVNGGSTGNDVIINNGAVAGDISGDGRTGSGSGNDLILNNGTAIDIFGDLRFGGASGSDVIVNYGAAANIYGDDSFGVGTGNDIITNGGTVSGSIIAADGSDTVIIQGNSATVGGVMDGGAGYDVLTFNLSSASPDELRSWAEQIYAANPAGGTLTLAGHTFTWVNFEELTQLLFTLARINGNAHPLAVFCAFNGGLDVYTVVGQAGVLSLTLSSQTISNGLARALESGDTLQIGGSATASVYVTPTGQVQLNAPNGFSFSFVYQNFCGVLPVPGEEELVQVAEEELPAFTIISRPR